MTGLHLRVSVLEHSTQAMGFGTCIDGNLQGQWGAAARMSSAAPFVRLALQLPGPGLCWQADEQLLC